MDLDVPVEIDLSDQECYVLQRGLREWGGPAHSTDELARAMGFADVTDLLNKGRHLAAAIKNREPLTGHNWRRTLTATEIAFVSDVYGSGWDWSITSGLSDETTIRLLRAIQRKIAVALRGERS